MARPDLYVVARFLGALARDDRTWSRSRLQAAVRLNYDLFRAYLAVMADKGWATEDEDGIRITPQGQAAHAELVAWLARYFEGERI